MELNRKIIAVVQARMGSTRLPGKILKNFQDIPMLIHIVNRLKTIEKVNNVIIATSDLPKDDKVYKVSKKYDVPCYRGSETDVLNRFYCASKMMKGNHIIRVTGDCPLVDPEIIDKLINLYFKGNFDFCGLACGAGVSNEKKIKRYPDGLDAEIFSFELLKEANRKAKTNLHREHVTPYMWQNKSKYKVGTLVSDTDYSSLRFTVDNEEDLEFVNWIYNMLYPKSPRFNLYDILQLLKDHPSKINNNHLIGQEGYEEFWG